MKRQRVNIVGQLRWKRKVLSKGGAQDSGTAEGGQEQERLECSVRRGSCTSLKSHGNLWGRGRVRALRADSFDESLPSDQEVFS